MSLLFSFLMLGCFGGFYTYQDKSVANLTDFFSAWVWFANHTCVYLRETAAMICLLTRRVFLWNVLKLNYCKEQRTGRKCQGQSCVVMSAVKESYSGSHLLRAINLLSSSNSVTLYFTGWCLILPSSQILLSPVGSWCVCSSLPVMSAEFMQ